MLRLTPEQQKALEALTLARDLQRVGAVLGQAFPEVDARLGERKPQLLELGWQRATALGLTHGLAVARYLAAWFVFGAEFEKQPAHDWAAKLLASPEGQREKSEGQRIYQLGRRGREELQRKAGSGLPAPAAFEEALKLLDTELAEQGRLGSLLPRERLKLGSACDLDAVDLTVIEPVPLQHYALQEGQWKRVPTVVDTEKLRVMSALGQAPLPAQVNLLSLSGGGRSRLRLRCLAKHVCDPAVHPLVDFNGNHGHYERRGPQTQDLQITLPLETPPPQPVMAVEGGPSYSQLGIAGCSLRDSGAPMGEQSVRIAVHPAEQTILLWRREAAPAVHLPVEPLLPPPAPQARVERDGAPLENQRWLEGLAQLDQQLAAKLPALLIAWERESGVTSGHLQAEPALMTGGAALTWGWAPHPDGLAAAPFYRVAGMLELVVCQLHLRLTGELALAGTRSLLHLHCGAREMLQVQCERGPADADLADVFKPAQTAFRAPFVLHLENIATPELAMVDAVSGVTGAIVGSAGLRPHPGGPGLQWFCKLAIEPASVLLQLHDPILGQQRRILKPLLPAMTLVDWSLD
ncbi:hypothetical protein [Pelomonas sp. KK5]|uniref:hypothetical protein n=1 Tax=Pelomonas sp. KK5 TaxID=1855730 RepID=UPI00097C7CF3|nr:hypothetical protein [Pelomonas sp. KK5]